MADAADRSSTCQGRDRRLGHRLHPSRLRRPAGRGAQLRRGQPVLRHRGARDVRRRGDRREPRHHRHRGHRLHGAAPHREGRDRGRDDPTGRRSGSHSLGGGQRSARDQSQPRGRARPEGPDTGHLLGARGVGGRVRVLEGCGARGRRRQRRRSADDAVAVRELSGRTPSRHRRQRADAHRQRPGLLEPRSRSSTTCPRPARRSSPRSRRRSPRCAPAAPTRDIRTAAQRTTAMPRGRRSRRRRSRPRPPCSSRSIRR